MPLKKRYRELQSNLKAAEENLQRATETLTADHQYLNIQFFEKKLDNFVQTIANKTKFDKKTITEYLTNENVGMDVFRKDLGNMSDQEKDTIIENALTESIQKEIIIENNNYDASKITYPDEQHTMTTEIKALKDNLLNKNQLTFALNNDIEYLEKNVFTQNANKTNALHTRAESIGNIMAKRQPEMLQNGLNVMHDNQISNIANNKMGVPDNYGKMREDSTENLMIQEDLQLDDLSKANMVSLMTEVSKYIPDTVNELGQINTLDDVFGNLFNATRKKAEEAIKNNNTKGITDAVKEHKANIQIANNLIELGDRTTNHNFLPSNCSPSRIEAVPYDIRKNYAGASRVNYAINLVKLARLAKVSPKEFMDNPFLYTKIGVKNACKSFTNKLLDNGNVSDMTKIVIDGTASRDAVNTVKYINSVNAIAKRGLENLVQFNYIDPKNPETSNPTIQNDLVKVAVFEKMVTEQMVKNSTHLFEIDDLEEKQNLMRNIIVANPEDRDINKLMESPTIRDIDNGYKKQEGDNAFDWREYVKTNAKDWNPTEKTMELYHMYESLKNSHTFKGEDADQLDTFVNNITIDVIDAAKYAGIKTMDIEKFAKDPENFVNTNTYKKCVALEAFKKDMKDIKPEKLTNMAENIQKMEDVYNNRNIFVRWFSPSVRKEKAMIEQCKADLSHETNVPIGTINAWIKANRENNVEMKQELAKVMTNIATPVSIKEETKVIIEDRQSLIVEEANQKETDLVTSQKIEDNTLSKNTTKSLE